MMAHFSFMLQLNELHTYLYLTLTQYERLLVDDKRILLRFKYSTQFKRREENNGDGLLRLPKCKEHCLFGANMLSVTCNMLSFVRDSVGRAYAALKLSIIKQEWYQKVPQHNNWKTSMHRLHLSLGGGGGGGSCTDICETSRKSTRQGFVLFFATSKAYTNKAAASKLFSVCCRYQFLWKFLLDFVGMSSKILLFHT